MVQELLPKLDEVYNFWSETEIARKGTHKFLDANNKNKTVGQLEEIEESFKKLFETILPCDTSLQNTCLAFFWNNIKDSPWPEVSPCSCHSQKASRASICRVGHSPICHHLKVCLVCCWDQRFLHTKKSVGIMVQFLSGWWCSSFLQSGKQVREKEWETWQIILFHWNVLKWLMLMIHNDSS